VTRRQNGLATWLAALAIALHALWPLLAQARPASAVLVPVCTIDGVTHYLELPAGKTPLERQSSAHHEHCSFCAFEGGRIALTGAQAGLFLPDEVQQGVIAYRWSAAPPSLRHPSSRPRAPPSAL
jgi:hypothetical protein